MSQTLPLFETEGFIICFEELEEDRLARHHFIKECGWSDLDYRKIARFDWFTAKVTAWKSGKELGTEYLGCCSYKKTKDFYTTYANDYFADMVRAVIAQAKAAP